MIEVIPSKVVVPSILTAPLELIFNIGIPDISDTENRSPVKSSVIENSCP